MASWSMLLRSAVLLAVTLAVIGESSPRLNPFHRHCRVATACAISRVMQKLSALEASVRKLSSKPFVKSLTWHQAVASCRSMGARLDAPRSAAEYDDVLHLLHSKNSPGMLWPGASDIARQGTFSYDGGGGLSFAKWSRGQPDNAANKDCLELRKSFHYLFNDFQCQQRNPSYLCRF